MKARIKFAKTGSMKYVGHLDIMRYFQKAIRRSGIPIKYSEGFNPHQIMSFAAPLGVGITSEGEYFDVELTEAVPSAEAIASLNATMVEGMQILRFDYLKDDVPNAMSSLAAASYRLSYKHPERFLFTIEELKRAKKTFFDDATEIPVTKKTKKGERLLDLKPLVYRFDIEEENDRPVFDLFVSTGSTDNIKPEFVLEKFFQSLGVELAEYAFFIHRKDMFTRKDDAFLSLGAVGYER